MLNILELLESTSIKIDQFNNKIILGNRLSESESNELSKSIDLLPHLESYKKNNDDLEYAIASNDSSINEFIKELSEKQIMLLKDINRKLKEQQNENISEFIIEIRAGAGGEESSLFSKEIINAYIHFFDNNNVDYTFIEISQTDSGGYSFISVEIQSELAYSLLKYEGGVHRVQRVPKTESSGRIHTSTISIAILPISKHSDIEIRPGDIRIDVYRSSGNGGQSVNTTDSAVRITHLPSGLVVTCQNTKSQIKNKEMALKVLLARLQEEDKHRTSTSLNSIRTKQIQSSNRSEKIRTYNFLQDRITDHRVKLDFSNIEKFMQGEIEPILIKIKENLEVDLIKY